MINAKEAFGITEKANYEKDKNYVEKLITSSANDFGYVLHMSSLEIEHLDNILKELGCIYNKETFAISLTQYVAKDSFMGELVSNVEKQKNELLKSAEEAIRKSANNCHRSVVFSSSANKYQNQWVIEKLLTHDFDACMNQEGDIVIYW